MSSREYTERAIPDSFAVKFLVYAATGRNPSRAKAIRRYYDDDADRQSMSSGGTIFSRSSSGSICLVEYSDPYWHLRQNAESRSKRRKSSSKGGRSSAHGHHPANNWARRATVEDDDDNDDDDYSTSDGSYDDSCAAPPYPGPYPPQPGMAGYGMPPPGPPAPSGPPPGAFQPVYGAQQPMYTATPRPPTQGAFQGQAPPHPPPPPGGVPPPPGGHFVRDPNGIQAFTTR